MTSNAVRRLLTLVLPAGSFTMGAPESDPQPV